MKNMHQRGRPAGNLPSTQPRHRQLTLAMDVPALIGIGSKQRESAIRALAKILLQAANVRAGGHNDER